MARALVAGALAEQLLNKSTYPINKEVLDKPVAHGAVF